MLLLACSNPVNNESTELYEKYNIQDLINKDSCELKSTHLLVYLDSTVESNVTNIDTATTLTGELKVEAYKIIKATENTIAEVELKNGKVK